MDNGNLLTLGAEWDNSFIPIPREFPTFAWHYPHLLVAGDPHGEVDINRLMASTPRLGFSQYGPLAILMMKVDGLPATSVDAMRPYLAGDEPPEITVEDADHILWNMVTVQKGRIANMRAFTTSPRVTVYLRRVFAEQRAHGPISLQESDALMDGWQASCPDEKTLWRRAVVTCKAGD